MMRILYISRPAPPESTKRGLRTRLRRSIRSYLHPFDGQDSFFLGSLCSQFNVTIRPLNYLTAQKSSLSNKFNWVFVSQKCGLNSMALRRGDITELKNIVALRNCNLGLLVNTDKAADLPNNKTLDFFDVIFKREHFRDLDKYTISEDNKRKIRTTMLGCLLINPSRLDLLLNNTKKNTAGFDEARRETEYDVFFLGSSTNPIRTEVFSRLKNEDLSLFGGIQPKYRVADLDPQIIARKVTRTNYGDIVRRSKINLALEGIGEFTHRHLEIWYLSSFMISTPSLRDLQLPLGVRENEHYVTFDSTDDLVDKVYYYKDKPLERRRIAEAGRKEFSRCYDFCKHGEYIKACLENRATSLDAV